MVLLVVLVSVMAVVADPSYQQQKPCYPETQYVTQYKTEYQQVSK